MANSVINKLDLAAKYIQNMLMLKAPKRSWNLTFNGIRVVAMGGGQIKVVVGGEPAPYAIYTNEPWINPKWNGKQNPNEKWIENTIHSCANTLKLLFQTNNKISIEEFEEINEQIKSRINHIGRERAV